MKIRKVYLRYVAILLPIGTILWLLMGCKENAGFTLEETTAERLNRIKVMLEAAALPKVLIPGLEGYCAASEKNCMLECYKNDCYVSKAICLVGMNSKVASFPPRHLHNLDTITVSNVCESAIDETSDQAGAREADITLWQMRENGVGRAFFEDKPIPEWAAVVTMRCLKKRDGECIRYTGTVEK